MTRGEASCPRNALSREARMQSFEGQEQEMIVLILHASSHNSGFLSVASHFGLSLVYSKERTSFWACNRERKKRLFDCVCPVLASRSVRQLFVVEMSSEADAFFVDCRVG
jgi:hypothetical protein